MKLVKSIIQTPVNQRCRSSQQGLWHGVKPQSGNQTCFSEKKSRRSWLPNVVKYKFYSQLLESEISTHVTTKALKCIRKFNGFDNYILMTNAKKLDSLYGEYLRRLMLKKLNDPTFQVKRIALSQPLNLKLNKLKSKLDAIPAIWLPLDIRYKDLSHLNVRSVSELSPRELRKHHELARLAEEFQDIPSNHPLIQEMKANNVENTFDMEAFKQKGLLIEQAFKKKLDIKELAEYYGADALLEEDEKNPNATKQKRKPKKQNQDN